MYQIKGWYQSQYLNEGNKIDCNRYFDNDEMGIMSFLALLLIINEAETTGGSSEIESFSFGFKLPKFTSDELLSELPLKYILESIEMYKAGEAEEREMNS